MVSDDWELGTPSASHHEANSVTNPIRIKRTAESKPGGSTTHDLVIKADLLLARPD